MRTILFFHENGLARSAGEFMLTHEWTRLHGQHAGLRSSWLAYGYCGSSPTGRANVGQDGPWDNGTDNGTRRKHNASTTVYAQHSLWEDKN